MEMKICECGKSKAGARSGKCYRCYHRGYKRATRTAPGFRVCQGECGKRKPVSEFYTESRIRLDGSPCYKSECIACTRLRQQANREKEKARREAARQREAKRERDVPGMKVGVCPHGVIRGSWPCMQCSVARRELIVELTD